MAIWADMLELFSHTVTVEPWVSEDTGGNVSYGTAVTYEAYIRDEVKQWPWEEGPELQSRRTIYVNGAVKVKDRFVLSTSTKPDDYVFPIHVIQRYDEDGFHHSEVYI